eukprot:2198639-Amphidinium_carterae.1
MACVSLEPACPTCGNVHGRLPELMKVASNHTAFPYPGLNAVYNFEKSGRAEHNYFQRASFCVDFGLGECSSSNVHGRSMDPRGENVSGALRDINSRVVRRGCLPKVQFQQACPSRDKDGWKHVAANLGEGHPLISPPDVEMTNSMHSQYTTFRWSVVVEIASTISSKIPPFETGPICTRDVDVAEFYSSDEFKLLTDQLPQVHGDPFSADKVGCCDDNGVTTSPPEIVPCVAV